MPSAELGTSSAEYSLKVGDKENNLKTSRIWQYISRQIT